MFMNLRIISSVFVMLSAALILLMPRPAVADSSFGAGLLLDRFYIGGRLEIGDQRLDISQANQNQIEQVTAERERLVVGFVGPEGFRVELSRWYQENTDIERFNDLANSRGFDAHLISQEVLGPFTPYLALGGGIFSYGQPLQLIAGGSRRISGYQYSIALGSHWLPLPWLELHLGLQYQWQRDEESTDDVDYRGESQTVDLGMHVVF